MNTNAPSPSIHAVTGAGGFIGSHLVEALLAQGHAVRALVHYNALGSVGHLAHLTGAAGLEIVNGDVQDARCMRTLVEGCSVVFHLAALIGIPYSYVAPQAYVNVNISGTLNLLETCRDAGVARMIHTSTSEVYGTAQRVPIDEGHPLRGQSPYSASKIAADKLAEAYHCSFGLPVVTARPFNTFGPRQSARAVLPTLLRQLLDPAAESVSLGSLDPVRDWVFVEDTAAAFLALGSAPTDQVVGKTFNIARGEGISVGEALEVAQRLTNIRKPLAQDPERMRPEASEVMRLIGDATALHAATGWKPRHDFEAGLRKTAEWIRRNPQHFRQGYTI